MALADNATAKANISWDFETLAEWEMPLNDWGIVPLEMTETETESEETGINYESQYGVIVMCKNETEQQSVFEKLTQDGFTCKVVVT